MVTIGLVALLVATFKELIQKLLFLIGKGLCWVVGFLSELFEMVSGLKTVSVDGINNPNRKLLIKVFFGNSNINTIYWGMALIGIVMCFGFSIFAVIRKSADDGDKVKQSMGGILRNSFKGIALILLMNFIISATISLTSTLMDRINYLIVNAQKIDMSYDVGFDTEDYACMARSLNTIGNYSLSASYNSRYNLNSCYNDIRGDLKTLADKGKFDITYISTTYDEDGSSRTLNTWQSVLQKIYRSVDDISVDQPLDTYNTKLSESLLEAMDIIKNDATFEALEKYRVIQKANGVGEMVPLDRMIMLLGSMYEASGTLYKGTGLTGYLRGPYYYGQKDIFSYAQCSWDFDMSLGTWLYLTVIIVAILFVKEMLTMVFNATARIFNMMLLYLVAPPIIAVTPLDDGGKLKQWTTAFIIQSFGLFGTIISMRLIMIFIPMLFSGDIQFFSSVKNDTFAKVVVMYGALFTARKAGGMIVGILADNAGMQAISAGDLGNDARGAVDRGVGLARTAGSLAWSAVRNDWDMAKSIYGMATGSGGGGGSDKAAEKAKETAKDTAESVSDTTKGAANNIAPSPQLDLGSHTNAEQSPEKKEEPENKSNVADIGPNGQGETPNGSFETGESGSARDYESNNRLQMEPVSEENSAQKSKTDENIQTSSRLSLENFGSTGSKQNANGSAPGAQQPQNQSNSEPAQQPQNQSNSEPAQQPQNQPDVQPAQQPQNQSNSEPAQQPQNQSNVQPAQQSQNQPNVQPAQQPQNQSNVQPAQQPQNQSNNEPAQQPQNQSNVQPAQQSQNQPNVQPAQQPIQASQSPSNAQPVQESQSQPNVQPAAASQNGEGSAIPVQTQPSQSQTGVEPIQSGSQTGSNSRNSTTDTSPVRSRQPQNQSNVQPAANNQINGSNPSPVQAPQPQNQPNNQPAQQPVQQPVQQPTQQSAQQSRIAQANQASLNESTQSTLSNQASRNEQTNRSTQAELNNQANQNDQRNQNVQQDQSVQANQDEQTNRGNQVNLNYQANQSNQNNRNIQANNAANEQQQNRQIPNSVRDV